jgi:hypothetical protein
MQNINLIEWLGYLASVLIAVSFLMKSIKKLRIVNIVGATLFVIYSIVIHAWPVALINTFIVIVNIYYISKKIDK